MKFRDRKINKVSRLIDRLMEDIGKYDGPVWYRGQSSKSYKLIPSFYRKETTLSEMTLIKKFKQNATLLTDHRSAEEFDWLFIMQHHGVPTRLLDWTESSLIALYFACCENTNEDGALWVLLPTELNKNAGIEPEENFDIPGVSELKNYSPTSYHVDRTNIMGPVSAITSRNTSRMQAQRGIFTIFHKKKTPIEEIGDKQHAWRYLIPKDKKDEILQELKICGIDKFQLFPELTSIGEILNNEFNGNGINIQ